MRTNLHHSTMRSASDLLLSGRKAFSSSAAETSSTISTLMHGDSHTAEPYEWAVSFERRVRELLLSGESKPLIGYENKLGKEAMLAVPTPDHYLPCYMSSAPGQNLKP